MTDQVLVTGAYGYIAAHCILQLLEQGYRVRGTLRNLDSHAAVVRQMFAQAGADTGQLELVQADLLDDRGWERAAQGCVYVLHVASPVGTVPRDQVEALVKPAREGTLRVLKAAAQAGVRRVVLTSSLAAVLEGHTDSGRTFDERDWSQVDRRIRPYALSKTLAERAAWDFVNQPDAHMSMELAVINPANVFGPLLDPRHTSSPEMILRMLRRAYPGCARLHWLSVDVRDVAAAHLLAMTLPQAAGERFCCITQALWMVEIARILNRHFADRGYRVPERLLPDVLVRLVTLFDPLARDNLAGLGVRWQVSNRKLVELLGWQPRPLEGSLVDTAESLIRFGLV